MARPTRQGVDYFPLDVYLDNKVKFLIIKFGLEGLGAIVTIFQEIYANGYWCKWGEDEKLIFTHENNIEIDKLNSIVAESLKRDIFDIELFEKYGILTSRGIQKRYKEIVSRRKDVEIVTEYLLVDNNFGVNTVIEPTECIHDVDMMNTEYIHDGIKSTQSKVNRKESRVKEKRTPVELKFNEDTIEYQLAYMLYEKILINDDRFKKPNFENWSKHIDYLIRLDKRTPEEIKLVINYVTTDSFEMNNVLSASKLRSRFTQLFGKAKQGGQAYAKRFTANIGQAKKEDIGIAERAGVLSL